MKPKIDQEKCIGCGTCPAIDGEVFEMQADNKAHVKEGVDYNAHQNQIEEAKSACPTQTIEVE